MLVFANPQPYLIPSTRLISCQRPPNIIFRCKIPTKWIANNAKAGFCSFFLISQPAASLPHSVHRGSDTSTAASLLTKLFILVLSVENNKTLNPRRAGEPYVPCSLSFEGADLPPPHQRRLDLGGFCLLTHLRSSCVIMDGDYSVVVGRGRPQLIIRETKSPAC